ncbi:hypothetical protein RRF57_006259 [Xylaria bambusicola]|uniref:Uncharacterized protein n=1 Tax=Xylaria bambusicola TaxID=326684 RepID=A0AAN7UZ45_9PEZI
MVDAAYGGKGEIRTVLLGEAAATLSVSQRTGPGRRTEAICNIKTKADHEAIIDEGQTNHFTET